MANLKLTNVSKHYGDNLVVNDLSVEIAEGEFFALLGPSGCGKSTTLRMIAGFEETKIGIIEIDGVDVSTFPPEQRNIGFVFQNYAIFPHMNVYNNIAFGLRLRKMSEDEIHKQVRHVLKQVGMIGFENRFRSEMSGGQQQRIALARALVTQPRILLLDEPLSALDKNLREEMKFWIKDLQMSLGITSIYVTHDQGEALTMSDRIAVMHKGSIAQVGTPREIYEQPANKFVTEFVGQSNTLIAKIIAVSDKTLSLDVAGQTIVAPKHPQNTKAGDMVVLALRPERIFINHAFSDVSWNTLKLQLKQVIYQGAFVRFVLALGDQHFLVETPNRYDTPSPVPGDIVEVCWHIDSGWVIVE